MSRLDFPYDTAYSPPAPVVDIIVKGQADVVQFCRALIDSSSSVSCIPVGILESVRAPDVGEVTIRTFLGESRAVRRRKVTIGLGGTVVELELYVLPHDSSLALLGRDFLNKCRVVLDGRAQKVSVEN